MRKDGKNKYQKNLKTFSFGFPTSSLVYIGAYIHSYEIVQESICEIWRN